VEVPAMGAQIIGSTSIAAGSTIQWFIHGYSAFDVVNFSLSVFGGVSNHADATLVQGEKILHVDITQGYLVSITNNYAYDSCTAYLLANVETAPTS
jgi:hypothetical protein